jgi:hypothetical protein
MRYDHGKLVIEGHIFCLSVYRYFSVAVKTLVFIDLIYGMDCVTDSALRTSKSSASAAPRCVFYFGGKSVPCFCVNVTSNV